MIKNCDGTPYQPVGELTQFDPDSREHDLFNLYDEEVIQFGGTPIFYKELFIQKNTLDPLFREDRGKIWANNGIQLYGFYEPIPSQNYMNMFGVDGLEEMQFEFNYRAVLKKIGHPPKVGSILFTPHRSEYWEIVQNNLGEFKFWGGLRLQIIAKKFQESSTTGEGRVSQQTTGFKINEGSLFR